MINVYVERISHNQPRGAVPQGREIRIEAGKRAEYPVAAGQQAVLYVIEGSVRLEGDDTAAGEGDTVYFKPPAPGDEAMVGVEADMPFRGVLVT